MILKENHIVTDIYEVWMQDGIICTKYTEPVVVDYELSSKVLEVRNILCDGRPYPILADSRKVKYYTKEARAHHATEEYSKYIKAAGIVINSHALAIIYNFFIKFNGPKYPVKAFSKKRDAIIWLSKFKS